MKNIFLFLLISVFTASCAPHITKHGYIFESDNLQMISEGVTDKEAVLKIMGSPTIVSDVDYRDESWIYYSEDVKSFLFFKPEIIDRKILLVEFNNEGTIKNLQKISFLDDSKTMKFTSDFTTVNNHKVGFFKSLFDNVGQVKPQ